MYMQMVVQMVGYKVLILVFCLRTNSDYHDEMKWFTDRLLPNIPNNFRQCNHRLLIAYGLDWKHVT